VRLSRAARIRRTAHLSGGGGGAQGEGSNASLPSTAWHGSSICFAASRLHYPKMLLYFS